MNDTKNGAFMPHLHLVEKFLFNQRNITLIIISSAILVFFDGLIINAVAHELFDYIHWAITMLFIMEAFVKIRKSSFKVYLSCSSNRLDFSLVILSILFLSLPSLNIGNVGYLRLLRLITVIRSIRLVPNSDKIFSGITRALSASKAVLAMLVVLLFIFSMIGYTLFSNDLPIYFGDPLSSMNTVFSIFTIENWNALPEIAKEKGDFLFYMVNTFSIVVLIVGGFIALSLANAVFVDEMVADNNDDVLKEIEKLRDENAEIKQLLLKIMKDT